MRIAVTFPIYITNLIHLDFLHKTTQSIQSTQHELIIIPVENHVASQFVPLQYVFTQQPTELRAVQGRQPQSVAKGWNTGIEKGIELGCEYILVLNTDIVLRSDAIDKLVAFAEQHTDLALVSMGESPDLFTIEQDPTDENWSEHPNFSAFMVHKYFFSHVGKFDETFTPAYYEDNDMHARLALANQKAVVYGGARMFHFGSRTVNSDEEYKQEMPAFFRANAARFAQKWGILPVSEPEQMRVAYWEHPYADESKSLKDW